MTQQPPESSPDLEPATSEVDQPSPERKFVQNSVNAFIRWMPLGGSGWLFVSFVLQEEWALTLLTFPVTVVTAVWAAYSKHFIEQLQAIYAERGKEDANKLVAWVDSTNEALKWQFSGFETKYLKCQRLDCQDDTPVGVRQSDRIFTPLLQEVFVPLRLTADSVMPGYALRKSAAELPSPEDLEACRVLLIWDLLRQVRQNSMLRQIAIRAWGGYGKTTLLKHLAYTYGGREYRKYGAPRFVPFLLYLARCWQKFQEFPKDDALSLPNLLTQYHLATLPQGSELQPPPHWARNLLKENKALVMFDGFDEVPPTERSMVSEWLSQQMRHYPNAVFIVTSRPAAYRSDYTAKPPTASFWVDDFNDDQRRRFVEQWYFCQERYARGGRRTPDVEHRAKQSAASLLAQIEARPELKAIAGNVLLLNMMARFHREKEGVELPNRKVELYQDICEMQLGRRPKAKGQSLLLNAISQRQEVLQHVALAMMQNATDEDEGFKQIRHEDLLDLLAVPLQERDPEVAPQKFLDQVVQISELLVEREGGVYEFAHLSFQEFLAASEVVRLKQESLLYGLLEVDAWKPTILFYADMVNPTHLIREALNRQAVNIAYEIWRNTSKRIDLTLDERRELEALKNPLQNSRYAKLEEYLRNGQWKEADNETYRLMITTVGKEEGQYFEPEELLNFPCEELLAIDGLWVNYSEGRFGFSVQKDIYLSKEVGGIADGKYYKEAWNRFCHKVGWKVDGNYAPIRKYDTSAPRGHLPRERSAKILFSRIQTCKL
ncbi:MAG: GUN4 domain-containing protein [Synechococcales bacterium]|nr:GUN4 domain-containing protein [Synechococcales bacterium]